MKGFIDNPSIVFYKMQNQKNKKNDLSDLKPWTSPQSKRRKFKQRLILSAIGIVVIILAIFTISIAIKNARNPVERVKESAATADPYFFTDATPTPVVEEVSSEPAFEEVSKQGWITTKDFGSSVKVRTQPTTNAMEVTIIRDREPIEIIGVTATQQDGYQWYQIKYNEEKGYIRGDFITFDEPKALPNVLYGVDVEDVISGKSMYSRLDFVSHAAPNVLVDLTLADEDNFFGQRMYDADVALIQYSTGEKLAKAAAIFADDGYQLMLWDAYRPYSVTVDMYKIVDDTYLTANPSTGSKFNRGAAVDVTLYKGGQMVDMPTDDRVLDINESSRTSNMTDAEKQMMDYLTKVMTSCGFVAYKSQWWHFNDSDWADYPVMDFPLSEFQ